MITPQILSWALFALFCSTSIAIISLHSYVDANTEKRSGLAPLHITGLAVVVCGFAAICAHFLTKFDVWFAFYVVLSLIAIISYGLVIAHLRRRVINEISQSK